MRAYELKVRGCFNWATIPAKIPTIHPHLYTRNVVFFPGYEWKPCTPDSFKPQKQMKTNGFCWDAYISCSSIIYPILWSLILTQIKQWKTHFWSWDACLTISHFFQPSPRARQHFEGQALCPVDLVDGQRPGQYPAPNWRRRGRNHRSQVVKGMKSDEMSNQWAYLIWLGFTSP